MKATDGTVIRSACAWNGVDASHLFLQADETINEMNYLLKLLQLSNGTEQNR